jgi:hypothetical protein
MVTQDVSKRIVVSIVVVVVDRIVVNGEAARGDTGSFQKVVASFNSNNGSVSG